MSQKPGGHPLAVGSQQGTRKITQKPFSIYIETKNWDWFYGEQFENHLESLHQEADGLKMLLALGNFEGATDSRFNEIKDVCKKKYRKSILFSEVTFESFIQSFNIGGLPNYLSNAVTEFRSYLDEGGLLPSWKQWLDVVNCAAYPDEVMDENVYMCPATPGAYTHARCRYFGMYKDKCVQYVSDIEAVIDVEESNTTKLLWNNGNNPKEKLLEIAKTKVNQFRSNEYPVRIFLLGNLFRTNFVKDSYGGCRVVSNTLILAG